MAKKLHINHRIDESSLASLKWVKDLGEKSGLKHDNNFTPWVSEKTALVFIVWFQGKNTKSHLRRMCWHELCHFSIENCGWFHFHSIVFHCARDFAQCTISEILPSGNSTTIIHLQITHFQQRLYIFMLDLPGILIYSQVFGMIETFRYCWWKKSCTTWDVYKAL